jgi:hypothetical protein
MRITLGWGIPKKPRLHSIQKVSRLHLRQRIKLLDQKNNQFEWQQQRVFRNALVKYLQDNQNLTNV